MAPGVFDARSILAARKSLKVTGLSGALAGGVDEMKVLLRAGVKEGDDSSLVSKASISDKNAQALSAALDQMNHLHLETQMSQIAVMMMMTDCCSNVGFL